MLDDMTRKNSLPPQVLIRVPHWETAIIGGRWGCSHLSFKHWIYLLEEVRRSL